MRLISSGSVSICGHGIFVTGYLDQFYFHDSWTEKRIWPSHKRRCVHFWRMYLWQYDRQCGCSTMERKSTSELMFSDTQHLPETLNRAWRLYRMAYSITEIKPPGFLLVGSSEKNCVRWAFSWRSDPSTTCPQSLWRYSDTTRNIRTSEAIHDATCAHVYCIPWRPLRTTVVTLMGFWPWTVCQGSLFHVVLQCHLPWKLCISGLKVIWTFMIHFQSGITHWSLSVDLKLTLYTLLYLSLLNGYF